MPPTNSHLKSERVTAWITPDLKTKVDQVVKQTRKRQGDYTTADLVRQAIRQMIDQQEEVLGSKAHQVRTFKKHADHLEARLVAVERRLSLLSSVTLQLLAIVSAVQLKATGQSEVDPQRLIELAIRAAVGDKGIATLNELKTLAARVPPTESVKQDQ
jgi:hypothetical protein